MKSKLKITQYTDPYCIWCYAMEPAMRKIEFLLGDRVEFYNTLGVLVGDVKEIIGSGPFAYKRFMQLKRQMKEHFKEAAAKGGIPISVKHMDEINPEDITSLPASRAVVAMKLLDEKTAGRYLRRLREAFHSDDMNISKREVLLHLAEELPINQEIFREKLENGEAQSELEKDIAICQQSGVRAFPTIKLEYGNKSKIMQGFIEYDVLKTVIEEISSGEIRCIERDYSTEALIEYMSLFKKAAAIEIQTAFSLQEDELQKAIKTLSSTGMYYVQECGDSYFVVEDMIQICDPITGACRL